SAPSPNSNDGSNVTASQVGLGVQVDTIQGLFHQGGLTSTNQKTDLAISGDGFFLVKDTLNNRREFATRGGDFRIDDRGFMVTTEGYRVQGMVGGSIGYEVAVDSDGQWTFTKNEDPASGTIDPFKTGDIQLDYNKFNASEETSPFDPDSGFDRNSIVYTNTLYDATDWAGSHDIGSDPVLDANGNTSGWQAFALEAVQAVEAQRGLNPNGNNLVTEEDILTAVSNDFFASLFPNASPSLGTNHGLAGNEVTGLLTTLGLDPTDANDAATISAIQNLVPQTQAAAQQKITDVRVDETPDLTNFSIDTEGVIRYFLSDGSDFERGRVMLVDFNDTSALIREGRNLYSGFGAAGLKGTLSADNPDQLQIAGREGLGRIQQGTLELSNVDLTNEFAQMITTQRGFQAGSRIITVSDDILQEVVNLKR
ncbi:MAG: flagellar hook-basal body complex protein, partial [Verrucomicrobiota bacterium]